MFNLCFRKIDLEFKNEITDKNYEFKIKNVQNQSFDVFGQKIMLKKYKFVILKVSRLWIIVN